MTEKEEWFKEQCKQKGLSTEEITVFGGDSLTDLDRYYATNRAGDSLYGIQLKEGSYEMGYVSDLIEDGSFFCGMAVLSIGSHGAGSLRRSGSVRFTLAYR